MKRTIIVNLAVKLRYMVVPFFFFCANSSLHAKEALPDNIEIEFEGGSQFPSARLATIKKSEDACKLSGRPLPVLDEKELAKHLSVKGRKYYSGTRRYQEYVKWTAVVKDCKIQMIEERVKEINSDEQDILFTYRSDRGGKTLVTKHPQIYVQRMRSDREKRLSELGDPGTLWHKRVFPESSNKIEINGIPCNEMLTEMVCVWSKMPFHVPTREPIVIKRATRLGADVLAACKNSDGGNLNGLPANTLIKCSSAYEEKAIRLRSEIAMPAGIFEMPRESKDYPIEYK